MLKSPESPPDSAKTPRPSLWMTGVMTALHFLIIGYQLGASDHPLYLPYVPRYFGDAPAFDYDYYFPFGEHVYTTLWIAMAPLIRCFGWEWPVFMLYLVAKFFTFWGVWSLTVFLTRDRRAGWLAMMFFLFNHPVNTSVALHTHIASNRMVVLPMFLFSIRWFWERRYLAAGILAGLSFHIHGLTTLFEGLIVVICLASDPRYYFFRDEKDTPELRAVLKRMGLAAGVFALLCLPILIWKAKTPLPDFPPGFMLDDWLEIIYWRTSYVFPSVWNFSTWIGMLAWVMFFAAAYRLLQKDGALRFIVPALAVALLALLMQYLIADVLRNPGLINMQLSRGWKLWIIFTLIGVARLLSEESRKPHPWTIAICGAVAMAGMFWAEGNPLSYIGAALLFLAAASNGERRLLGLTSFSALVLLALIFLPLPQHPWRPMTAPIQRLYEIGLAFALIPPLLIVFYADRISSARWRAFITAAGIVLAGLVLAYWAANPSVLWKQPFEKWYEGVDLPGKTFDHPWNRIQLWAKENTPPDATFFTPPHLQGFRNFSERNTFCELKDGSQSLFDPEYALIWREHMRELTGWPPDMNPDTYHRITPERWRELSRIYGIEWLVTSQPVDLPFERLVKFDKYTIWRITNVRQ
ncbi:hypothetical protein JXA32_02890 [Candidatus Sumerlaeota bacterium]|nr:hypothetical protein [Candidatus Sumerlaeota bacterium]